MTRQTRWMVGAAVLLPALWLLAGPQIGNAADDDLPKDVKEGIQKIADLLEKDKGDDAKKEAMALAKAKNYDGAKVGGLKDPMHAFALRSKGGLGIGSKADAIKPDGIEAKIIDLGKKSLPAATLKDQADDIKKAAYLSLAIAELTAAATPTKDDPKKKIKDWEKWTKEMQTASKDLAAAADKKDAKGIMNAAKSLDGTCSACHQDFRPK